jgi:GTPase SAR1 family protein
MNTKYPNEIYLQIGEDVNLEEYNFRDLDVSWCSDNIYENDIKYVSETYHQEEMFATRLDIQRLQLEMQSILEQATKKLDANNERELSESYIEAKACIQVVKKLMDIIKK